MNFLSDINSNMISASGYAAALHIYDHYLARIVEKTYAPYAYTADFYVFSFLLSLQQKWAAKRKLKIREVRVAKFNGKQTNERRISGSTLTNLLFINNIIEIG